MNQRLVKPLVNIDNCLTESTFEEALSVLAKNIGSDEINKTLVLCSGNYSNEVLYQLQKFSRIALNTNALSALDYYNRGTDFFADKNDIVPFAEFYQADQFFCLFDKHSEEETLKVVNEIFSHCNEIPKYWFNTTDFLTITDYYAFFRSLNLYIIQNNLQKGIYIHGLGKNYEQYKSAILKENLQNLLIKNKLQISDIQTFVKSLISKFNPIFIVWERFLTADAYHEIENLCMLLEFQSKPAAGFITIKGDINSQGLFDMGFFPNISPGGEILNSSTAQKMEKIYGTKACTEYINIESAISQQKFKNVLLWNCTNHILDDCILNQVKNCEFSVLHTAFLPDNATDFDIILPANLPNELSGTYTDTSKVPHNFEVEDSKDLEYNNLEQISEIAKRFNQNFSSNRVEIFLEYISFMTAGCHSAKRHFFR